MADNNASGSQAGQGGQESQADENNNSQSQADQSNNNSQDTKLTIDQALEIIKDLRKEQASNRQKIRGFESAQTQAEKERKESEAKRLKEAGEFKALYETSDARVKELEPLQGKYNRLSELMGKQLEETIKDWPAEVKTFDPGKDAGVEARMEWVNKSKPLVEKLVGSPARPGNRPNPAAAGGNGKDVKAELRATGHYQPY